MITSRQAVVVIHGIGEQVPLATLRAFVGGPGTAEGGSDEKAGAGRGVVGNAGFVTSEPSLAALSVSERILVGNWVGDWPPTSLPSDEDGNPSMEAASYTDFYEFYWAPHFRDSTIADVSSWLLGLLTRPRSTFSSARILGPAGRAADSLRWVACLLLLLATTAAAAKILTDRSSFEDLAPWILLVAVLAAVLISTTLGLLTLARVSVAAAVVSAAVTIVSLVERQWLATATAIASGGIVSWALRRTSSGLAMILGDAARYLSDKPSSVTERDTIRQEVLDLLEKLPTLKDADGTPRYERVIVVGHSLGSVIAYDAITLLWARTNHMLLLPPPSQDVETAQWEQLDQREPNTPPKLAARDAAASMVAQTVEQLEEVGQRLRSAWEPDRDTGVGQATNEDREQYRELQRILFEGLRHSSARLDRTSMSPDPESRTLPRPEGSDSARWLISDLITVGSPLTYADALFVRHCDDLNSRFEERSLSRCPPDAQLEDEAAPYRKASTLGGISLWSTFHQACAFAPVVWTNIYFPHDLVGGPVRQHFGPAVRDFKLDGPWSGSTWPLLFVPPWFPHSHYWRSDASRLSGNRTGATQSLAGLRSVIRRPGTTFMVVVEHPPSDADLRDLRDLLSNEPQPSARPAEPGGVAVVLQLATYEEMDALRAAAAGESEDSDPAHGTDEPAQLAVVEGEGSAAPVRILVSRAPIYLPAGLLDRVPSAATRRRIEEELFPGSETFLIHYPNPRSRS